MSLSSKGPTTYASLSLELRQKILLYSVEESIALDIAFSHNMNLMQQGFRCFNRPITFLPNTHAWASSLKSTHKLVAADMAYVLKSKLDELEGNIEYWGKWAMAHSMDSGKWLRWICMARFEFPGSIETGRAGFGMLTRCRPDLTQLARKRIWSEIANNSDE
ncbi:hypothetical protein E2P81_ATG06950 [Venturia nashicola]|uniref:Uncharacterized protein n=1 Tax=Venturia nashicola TaxID=86259 RepID=A0A4Z1NXE4_9PEZI|nr:hypothetical protein E6O75_ATG07120 [Venturia nashicola]TLD30297.1 hypothetical protein E2P81_ATG06950 [Venturia nashicola]